MDRILLGQLAPTATVSTPRSWLVSFARIFPTPILPGRFRHMCRTSPQTIPHQCGMEVPIPAGISRVHVAPFEREQRVGSCATILTTPTLADLAQQLSNSMARFG